MLLPLLLLVQDTAPPPAAIHTARHYEITLVPADTGTHLLGEVQTSWTLRSTDPVAALLDSSMRVVRVLVDGRPNTRISRTMYGRSGQDVVVPHQKPAGDSISTRIRYHGFAGGDAWLGEGRGDRRFVAGGWEGARHWLPVPPGPTQRVTAVFHVQAPLEGRAIANGVLTGVDTLPYGHATWTYRIDSTVPLPSLAAATGHWAVTSVGPGLEIWTFPGDSAAALAGPFRRASAMVEHLTAMLGPMPYPRLVHVAVPAVPAPVAGGGLALYPESSFGRLDESAVMRATARQWLDGADSALAGEIAGWLAAEWAAGAPPKAGRLTELRKRLGDAAFRQGLRAFVRNQRAGRGTADDFSAAMQPR
jgi:aminopeptidase N